VLRRVRWGAFISHFLIRKWQKGVSVLGRDKAVIRVFYESQVMVGRVAAEPPRQPGRKRVLDRPSLGALKITDAHRGDEKRCLKKSARVIVITSDRSRSPYEGLTSPEGSPPLDPLIATQAINAVLKLSLHPLQPLAQALDVFVV
jgi:hypothetical protein